MSGHESVIEVILLLSRIHFLSSCHTCQSNLTRIKIVEAELRKKERLRAKKLINRNKQTHKRETERRKKQTKKKAPIKDSMHKKRMRKIYKQTSVKTVCKFVSYDFTCRRMLNSPPVNPRVYIYAIVP